MSVASQTVEKPGVVQSLAQFASLKVESPKLATPTASPDAKVITASTPEITDEVDQVRHGKRLVNLGAESSQTLSKSMQDDLIESAKRMNIKLDLEPDGSVGVAAVQQFQREFKMRHPELTWASKEDGIIGPRTMRALDMALGRTDKLLSNADFARVLDETAERYATTELSISEMTKAYQEADERTKKLGFVAQYFESGKAGPGTISSGQGDFGGKSYGAFQFASRTGTLQNFLKVSGYDREFSDPIGSPGFDQKWKELARRDPAFGDAQQKFMVATHFTPQMEKLKANGINLGDHGRAVQEAIFSTSTQYGPNSGVIVRALAGHDVSKMTDGEVVSAIQDYKASRVSEHFSSSSAGVQASVAGRIRREKLALNQIAVADQQLNS